MRGHPSLSLGTSVGTHVSSNPQIISVGLIAIVTIFVVLSLPLDGFLLYFYVECVFIRNIPFSLGYATCINTCFDVDLESNIRRRHRSSSYLLSYFLIIYLAALLSALNT